MFQWPCVSSMSAMLGSVRMTWVTSTRPARRARKPSRSVPFSSLRNGAVPNFGSSATSKPFSSTEGSGSARTAIPVKWTGRPRACEALLAISAWTRGVSTIWGRLTTAAIARTTIAATATRNHFKRQAAWIVESCQG